MNTSSPPASYTNREAAAVSGDRIGFSFGANWRKYIERLDEETIAHATNSFTAFCGRTSLAGETFVDLGSGSGLSSLVAYRLGAARILSVDVDPHSIQSTQVVRAHFAGDPAHWEVRQGSVLDSSFVDSLGQFSFVYSWGVLHHTGAMWQAIDHAQRCVAPGGAFFLALYNHYRHSRRWLALKRFYNRLPSPGQRLLRMLYGGYYLGRTLMLGKWPPTEIREYRKLRGMDVWRDIEDWLGGLPYEYCKPDEVVNRLAPQGFALRRLKSCWSHGCNEFLLTRDLPDDRHAASAPSG